MTVTAISVEDAVLAAMIGLIDGVSSICPDHFANRNMRKALGRKLNAIVKMIDEGNYGEALAKLQDDVLAKTDGCAASSGPDTNDWIPSCDEQEFLSDQVQAIMELLTRVAEN